MGTIYPTISKIGFNFIIMSKKLLKIKLKNVHNMDDKWTSLIKIRF